MQIKQAVALRQFSTMRLGGTAAYMLEVHSQAEVSEAVTWALEHNVPPIMIGTGSNIVWRDEGFNGLLLVNKIPGYQDVAEDELTHSIKIGAGEPWDDVVQRTVAAGLTGIEALSLIPGSTGATPVQNVGAYGQEIASTLVSVDAYDLHMHEFTTIANEQCGFGYRTSRFKTTDHGRFLITGVTLQLTKANPKAPFYKALQVYLDTNGIQRYTPAVIRAAVIAIRKSRLPDPAVVANNGSFFANPIIKQELLPPLQAAHRDLVYWKTTDGRIKLSAAWLVEQAGFKDYHDGETGMATWPAQALVLVNEQAKTTADLLKFKQKIVAAVQAKFNITLEQEPELLP